MSKELFVTFCAVGVFFLGYLTGELQTEHAIAKGEINCYYERSELICWNPKEEEK